MVSRDDVAQAYCEACGKANAEGRANDRITIRAARNDEEKMEDLFFGDGWLVDLLRQAGLPVKLKDRVREVIQALANGDGGGLKRDWKTVDDLLGKKEVGRGLQRAMGSLKRTVDLLGEALGEEAKALEKPFSPFLVRSSEIRKILHPREDVEKLAQSEDDLDAVISLEMINDARRLLASWGADVWGDEPLKIIPRLEEDLEELRKIQVLFQDNESLEDDDMEKEIEQADRFATMATRFARDLMELHLLNAANAEVRMRFQLLWGTVRQLDEDRNTPAAAFEAVQVLEEAFSLAGLGGGDLLQRVDLLYDIFSDAEDLRRTVDHLVAVSRDGEGSVVPEQGRLYIDAISKALEDMGLEAG
jgi:hypothetical protein